MQTGEILEVLGSEFMLQGPDKILSVLKHRLQSLLFPCLHNFDIVYFRRNELHGSQIRLPIVHFSILLIEFQDLEQIQ